MSHFDDLLNYDPDINYFSSFEESMAESCSKYVTISEYTSRKPDLKYLSLVNYNIRSFITNSDAFLACFDDNSLPNIFVFCETMFNRNNLRDIPGYIGYHVIRETCRRRSGGVSVFIKKIYSFRKS